MPETKLTDFVAIGSIASAVVTVTTAIVTRSIPWGKAKLASRAAKKQIESIFPDNIEEVVRYYVMPEASLDDPSLNLEDNRKGQPRRPKLFKALDDIFASGSSRYSFLLADSGMGKTSALINYYARHIRRWSHPFKIAIVSLSSPNPLQRIEALQSRENTVLFLDAFDEDQAAIKDYREHLNQLIQATYDFKALLITCRTQFFPSDADIPTETKRRKAGPRPAAEPSQYVFSKLYLCPFSEKDVRSYIRRRYPLWKFTDRHRILALIKRVPKLVHRPMLLAHLDTLARSRRDIECSVDLYEEMIEAWLKRESEVAEIGHMRLFSEMAAVDMFVNASIRGMERMPRNQIEILAKEWQIPLNTWILTSRSLLNRDEAGNYKFAHRTILEFLCLQRISRGDSRCLDTEWTDQMQEFFGEMIYFDRPMLAGIVRAMVAHAHRELIIGRVATRLGQFCKSKEEWILRTGKLSCAISLCSPRPFDEIKVIWVDVEGSRIYISQGFHARYNGSDKSYRYDQSKSRERVEISVKALIGLRCLPESADRNLPSEAWKILPTNLEVLTVAPKERMIPDEGRFPSAIIAFGTQEPDLTAGLHAQMVRIWRNAGSRAPDDFRRLSEL